MFEFIQLLSRLRNIQLLEQTPTRGICFDPRGQKYIQIVICEESKLDMSYFYKAYDQLDLYNQENPERKIQHIIFIYRIATIQIKKLKIYKDILCIEFFNENELRRLLIGNRFIPKHSRVEQELHQEIIRKFGKDHLPTLLHTDPIVRLYNFEVGDIIQIEREDTLYYRLVLAEE
jgi:DNA-directed RNA polymerase subunit H (RpoH/RPB5)